MDEDPLQGQPAADSVTDPVPQENAEWEDVQEESEPRMEMSLGTEVKNLSGSFSRTPSRKANTKKMSAGELFLLQQLRTMKKKVLRLTNRNTALKGTMKALRNSNVVEKLNNVNRTTLNFSYHNKRTKNWKGGSSVFS
ncbi:uncharacterized protein LOC123318669 [Coccinella septempunctata]|uniref:uncharacterized protein LOC123318669 n=1 Tax=Coccinella septempunctata TaxID=41139 RepID=UPI001D0844FB|nr:uncharacterized protein LOC123318669 [Coccinella septempunctata]